MCCESDGNMLTDLGEGMEQNRTHPPRDEGHGPSKDSSEKLVSNQFYTVTAVIIDSNEKIIYFSNNQIFVL